MFALISIVSYIKLVEKGCQDPIRDKLKVRNIHPYSGIMSLAEIMEATC